MLSSVRPLELVVLVPRRLPPVPLGLLALEAQEGEARVLQQGREEVVHEVQELSLAAEAQEQF